MTDDEAATPQAPSDTLERPAPPSLAYISMRRAAELLRYEPDAGGVLANTDEMALLAAILEYLAEQAEKNAWAAGFVDHEPYLSARALSRKILGL